MDNGRKERAEERKEGKKEARGVAPSEPSGIIRDRISDPLFPNFRDHNIAGTKNQVLTINSFFFLETTS